jgi:hypothetical protein
VKIPSTNETPSTPISVNAIFVDKDPSLAVRMASPFQTDRAILRLFFFGRCRWKTYSGYANRAFGGGILSIEMESPKYSIYCMTDIVNEKRVIYKIKNAKGPQRLSTVG